mgnify:CR=1 FL=1
MHLDQRRPSPQTRISALRLSDYTTCFLSLTQSFCLIRQNEVGLGRARVARPAESMSLTRDEKHHRTFSNLEAGCRCRGPVLSLGPVQRLELYHNNFGPRAFRVISAQS